MPEPAPSHAARGVVLGLVVGTGGDPVSGLRLQGRSLMEHAFRSLASVPGVDACVIGRRRGVAGLDPGQPWRSRAVGGLILHDPGCPLLRADTIGRLLESQAAEGPGTALVGVRPVTDTIKEVVDGAVVGTVDRAALAALASPVVVGPDLLDPLSALLPRAGDLADLETVVQALVPLGEVVAVEVPSGARRVADGQDVDLLECLHDLQHTLRER